ncbi:hybrid sensor histidine kinase/response regulator [Pyxidicoccus xibeiensis]|uniref:hybrid sensor histidine kinase/response regulator n=1 Tax=Pyxidicoccus xibeiensis TaxID=2906759 RepID=UPI0020A80634|nr:two-component regulator propeller domain-containing protein [Pyxidicoccus xibeiensis]MCP3136933.1 ATP-binding protein [Pyxidicoccus xibeiensis]
MQHSSMVTMRSFTALAVLLTFLAPASRAQDVDVPVVGALHREWGLDDGLPQSSALALAQTPDGHLYVGTQEGLARFDGSAWTVLDHSSAMPCEDVSSLLAESDGTLWVGTAGCGLLRYARGVFSHHPTRAKQGDDRVNALERLPDGTLWVATDHGLAYHLPQEDGGFELTYVAALGTSSILALAPAAEGGVWVGTLEAGLWRASVTGAERVSPPGSLKMVTALAADDDGTLWVGTREQGLWLRTSTGSLEPGPAEAPGRIRALRVARHGGLWVGTDASGFGRLKRGRFTRAQDVPLNAGVVTFLEDTEGSLWVGTFSASLHQLRRPEVEVLGKPEGLPDDFIWGMYEDQDGAMWIGTTGGLARRDVDGRLTLYGAAEGLPPGRVYDILRDREGTLWLATSLGLARLREGRFEVLPEKEGPPSGKAYALYEDREGSLWGATWSGLARRKDGQWRVFTVADGLSRNNVSNLREAPGGGLWLATSAGLDLLTDTGVRRDGPEKALAGRDVNGIFLDAQDPSIVWAATDDGLARLDGRGVAVARKRDGLPVNNLLSVVDDGRGYLWVGTNRGIFRVAKKELTEFFAGRATRVSAVTYGRSEGMRSVECNIFSNGSLVRTRAGELWFATISGVVRVPAAAEPRPRAPPPLHVTRVLSRGEPVDLEQGLPPEVPDVELHWAALTFVAPDKVRYRYWLEGYDTGWVEAKDRRVAYYTNLPPGEYRFRVQAESTDKRWGPVETGVLLRRPSRFFEAPGFLVTAGLVVAGGMLGAYRWRVGRLRARQKELSARVEERTRELATANAELREALETSAEGERSLRRLIDRLPVAITVYQDDRVVYVNDALLKLLGYERFEELESRSLFSHLPEDELVVLKERLAAVLRGEMLPERLSRVLRRDGSVALAEVCGVSLRFGGRMAAVSVARDVTESRRMEERLRLSDRMAGVGTLAAGVAHEINNPLAYVIGNQQFALERLEPLLQEADGEVAQVPVEALRAIADALMDASEGAGRVRHVVRDLKTFSRGDEETTHPLDVRHVVESALAICHNEVRHRARVRRDFRDVPKVVANDARLGQVFLNLVVNAAQAIPDGQAEQHEIALSTYTDARGRAVVEVADTGSGIAPEHLERIFDPFFTTKPVGVGTGLGLSICHGIVHSLGGEMQVESQVGKGTRFRVILPAAGTPVEVPKPRPVEVLPPASRRARLLVLDDEPLVARGMARLLAGECAAESTSSARDALARLSQGERFDLLLCDVMMPEMSGEAFFQRLAEVAPDQRERVVFITGGAFTPEARAFLERLPPGRCVQKPVASEVLRALVREQLARA